MSRKQAHAIEEIVGTHRGAVIGCRCGWAEHVDPSQDPRREGDSHRAARAVYRNHKAEATGRPAGRPSRHETYVTAGPGGQGYAARCHLCPEWRVVVDAHQAAEQAAAAHADPAAMTASNPTTTKETTTMTTDVTLLDDDAVECAACGSPGPAGECDFECPTLDGDPNEPDPGLGDLPPGTDSPYLP